LLIDPSYTPPDAVGLRFGCGVETEIARLPSALEIAGPSRWSFDHYKSLEEFALRVLFGRRRDDVEVMDVLHGGQKRYQLGRPLPNILLIRSHREAFLFTPLRENSQIRPDNYIEAREANLQDLPHT
jgi:hypothetical protein